MGFETFVDKRWRDFQQLIVNMEFVWGVSHQLSILIDREWDLWYKILDLPVVLDNLLALNYNFAADLGNSGCALLWELLDIDLF